jgi:peptide/nickel transport system substrate-binding protein/oligopeptide transport system substrate-binding protein
MPRAIPILAFLALAMSLIAAFAPDRSLSDLPPVPTGPPLPIRGGIYRVAIPQDPPTLDPATSGDTTSFTLALQLYNGLVQLEQGGAGVAPCLATSWKISKDGKVYTFFLRKGVMFRGKPGVNRDKIREVTAQDVKYSFERVLWPELSSPAATTFEPIEGSQEVASGSTREVSGIKVLDKHTVQITLSSSFAPFLASLTMPNAFIVEREAIEEAQRLGPGSPPNPIGTGPFLFSNYLPGKRIDLVANPAYWDQTPGQPQVPYLDGLHFVIEKDEGKRFDAFLKGQLHHTDVPDPVYGTYAQDPYFNKINQLGTYYLGFQCQTPPFDDLRVRRAFSHAIDKNAIVRYIRARRVQAARGPLPPNIPGYSANLETYEFDPDRAEELLDEAGYPRDPRTGVRLTFPSVHLDIAVDESNLRVARAVQANLLDVGVAISVRRHPWKKQLELVRSGKSPFHRMGWVADYLDADNFLYYNFFSGNIGSSNGNFYANRDVDELLTTARYLNNPRRRLKLYNKAERLIVRDAPWICLFYYQSSLLRRPEVHGLNLTALGMHMIHYDRVWLSPETSPPPDP